MLSNGDVFAGYVIERTLGRGGMGSVYLAKHPRLPRMTALKLLNREMVFDKEIRARFEREADLVSGLDHHNIVTVYDRGLEDGQLWISMQYIDGVDASSVNPQALPPERAVQIVAETADALDYAHRNEVLHRDVKPANILLARSTGGKGERVYLTDFGIARLRDETSNLTQTGTFTATLAYASPEQLTGSALDGRSDQYSLACTLFWLLTGSGPFQATNPAAVIQGHLQNPPPPAANLRPGLPPALDMVIAKAMAKRPEDRFASCSEFAAAARRALAAPSAPAMPLVNPRTAPPMPFANTGGANPTVGPMTGGPTPTAAPMTGGPMQTAGPRTAGPNPTAAPVPYPTMVNTATPPPQPVAGFTPNRPTNQYTTPGYNYSNPGNATVPPPGVPPGMGQAGPRPPMPPRKSNTGLIIGAILGVLVLAIVVVVVVAAAGDDSGNGSAGGTTTTTVSTNGSSPSNADLTWSTVSQEFPRMVPSTKSGEDGYNGATCWLADASSPPEADEGEPDFGNWTVQWRCFGGGNNEDPFYRIYGYDSSADVQSVVSGLTSAKKSTDTNGGNTYTNYQFTDQSRPRMVTNFTGDSDRAQMLMYTDGVVGSIDEVLRWWRSAPLN
ncbi:protein kinase [Nocardia huaxiensis]|uniref:non-specific serine/threonine protein kinase n=1 Tax=Nocardia huaxiensis TaxID=2755382 RepID=A0A7D6ZQI5_9NOCA|nr:serine/threonine-protein kinase [Nocardia huaxiensis]QLY32883.1 protein kinase [Nocardia huaxiensis]